MGEDVEHTMYDVSYCFIGILGVVTCMLINTVVSLFTGGKSVT